MIVQKVVATVYRGGGRRFFSRKAAFRAEAIARIKRRYPCHCDHETGDVCDRHAWDTMRWARMVRKYAALLMRADSHAPPRKRP